MRVIDFLDQGASKFPDRHVVHDGQQGITYRNLQLMTHQIANAIRRAGMGPGVRIALLSPNHVLGYAAQFGVFRSGAVFVPLNARNSVAEGIDVLTMLDVDWLLFHSSFSAEVERFKGACDRLRGFVCVDKESHLGPSLLQWIEGEDDQYPDVPAGPDDVYMMATTSGTTGRPKGVMATHLSFECSTASMNYHLHFDEPPVHLVAAPLSHAAGAISSSMLAAGVTHMILPTPSPVLILEWIERYKASVLFLPPTLIYMLLNQPTLLDHDYSSLKYFVYGAAPISADKLRQACRVFGDVFVQLYAQSEAGLALTVMTPADHAEALADPLKEGRLLSCGRPGPFVRLEIMDDEGRLMPRGTAGEIVVRANLVMRGYYKNAEATKEVSAHGWHHTGDIGKMDDAGFVYLVDRKKDMIITGGFNVYPGEVEQVIWTHPAVMDCAVVGVPDDKWGEAVTAVVELKAGATIDADELIALCKERLGSVKAPKSVHIWESLPRSPVGKVLKREIRARFWSGQSRAI